MQTRTLAVLSGLALVVCGVVGACERERPREPNLLLVSIDTLRADHLGAYGYERETSPFLDELARGGALFENAYSQSASTVPSHASLFTGRYPFQHGTWWYKTPLPDEELTLAEILKDAGYRTLGVASSVRFHEGSGFRQGFDFFEEFETAEPERSAQAVERMRREIARESGRPFFAFVHLLDPHEPYAPPAGVPAPWHPGDPGLAPEETSKFLQAHRSPDQVVDPKRLAYLEALYDAEILHVDRAVRALIESLPTDRSTIVVLTSDHGDEFKEHGGFSHSRDLHEEVVRVPLIVHWPGRIRPGTVIPTPVQGVDVLPTLLELMGRPRPGRIEGRSYAPVLLGDELPPAEEGRETIVLQQGPERWAVVATLPSGRFKLSKRPSSAPVLFRLDDDPGGHVEIDADFPEERRALLELAADVGLAAPPERSESDGDVAPDVLRRLRALGYVDETRPTRDVP